MADLIGLYPMWCKEHVAMELDNPAVGYEAETGRYFPLIPNAHGWITGCYRLVPLLA